MKKSACIIFLTTLFGCTTSLKSIGNRNEWTSLFNGRDIKDWNVKIHHHKYNENYGNTFRVENGMIRVKYDKYGNFNDQFGHLYYKTPFSSYHLKLKYRFVGQLQKGAPSYTLRNSGVMFHSQDPASMPEEQDWPVSIEMQFLGGLSDGRPRSTGNMCSPGTEIFYQGKLYPDHCLDSKSKTFDGDQWVSAELIVRGDSIIKHIINGDTVLQYSKPQIGGGVANGFDPKIKIDGKALKNGFIALQSEGQPVDFKDIYIKKL